MSSKKSDSNGYRHGSLSDQSTLPQQSSRRKSSEKSLPALFPNPLMLKSEARRFKSLVV